MQMLRADSTCTHPDFTLAFETCTHSDFTCATLGTALVHAPELLMTQQPPNGANLLGGAQRQALVPQQPPQEAGGLQTDSYV